MVNLTVICDGGSRGNGSPGAIGYGSFMVLAGGNTAGKNHSRQFGVGVTNNEAEYQALIAALQHIQGAFAAVGRDLKTVDLTIQTDSQLVIGHIRDKWKVKASLAQFVTRATYLCHLFSEFKFEKIKESEMKQILGH
jgi:ribonuclease HI